MPDYWKAIEFQVGNQMFNKEVCKMNFLAEFQILKVVWSIMPVQIHGSDAPRFFSPNEINIRFPLPKIPMAYLSNWLLVFLIKFRKPLLIICIKYYLPKSTLELGKTRKRIPKWYSERVSALKITMQLLIFYFPGLLDPRWSWETLENTPVSL